MLSKRVQFRRLAYRPRRIPALPYPQRGSRRKMKRAGFTDLRPQIRIPPEQDPLAFLLHERTLGL